MFCVLIMDIILFGIQIFVSARRNYTYKVRLFSAHLYNKSGITHPNSFSHPMQNGRQANAEASRRSARTRLILGFPLTQSKDVDEELSQTQEI